VKTATLAIIAACLAAALDGPARAGTTGLLHSDVSNADVVAAESQAQRSYDLLPALPPVPQGGVKVFHIVAEVKPWEVAPGVVTQAWTYSGTVPGPTIHVRQGDHVRVLLTNHLPEATTVHWHGLPVDADMDGVPGLSQNPIQPGETFAYVFRATEPGTYIYHTHFDDLNQLDRGLYGAVVVDEAKPARPSYTRDYLMLLSSWRIFSDAENYFSINGKSYPLTKAFKVKSGDRVRIREINISGTESHTMHVHGHRFEVVAVDGQPVAQASRQRMITLLIGPGETRDIAFRADAKPGTWLFHCHIADHMMNSGAGPGGLVTAVQYENAPDRLSALAGQDVMQMSNSGAGGGGGKDPSGAPLSQATTLVLGAIAGLTIFFGLPFAAIKRVSPGGIAFFNAIAIGVLFFLLFDILRQAGEPLETALQHVEQGAPKGPFWGLLLTYLGGFATGLLSLVFFSRSFFLKHGAGASMTPLALATVIAAGIGLHNFSEGLAIGESAATGAIQLALLLIVGFGLHNMTEGFGIAAPLAGSGGTNVPSLVKLGLIGGAPTFFGTVIGYHFVSPLLSVLFLTLAAGAIIYVIGEMMTAGRRIGYKELATVGIFVGFAVGLGTDLILTAAGA